MKGLEATSGEAYEHNQKWYRLMEAVVLIKLCEDRTGQALITNTQKNILKADWSLQDEEVTPFIDGLFKDMTLPTKLQEPVLPVTIPNALIEEQK